MQQDRASALLAPIATNRRGTSLTDLATIVSLIRSTHNRSGLRVRSEPTAARTRPVSPSTDVQLPTVRLERHRFHSDWNTTPLVPTADR